MERGESVVEQRKDWRDKMETASNPNPNLGLANLMLNSSMQRGKWREGGNWQPNKGNTENRIIRATTGGEKEGWSFEWFGCIQDAHRIDYRHVKNSSQGDVCSERERVHSMSEVLYLVYLCCSVFVKMDEFSASLNIIVKASEN